MTKKYFSTAFVCGLLALSQAYALPGPWCPDEAALRVALPQKFSDIEQQKDFTLTVKSEDGQMRTWNVRPQLYLHDVIQTDSEGNQQQTTSILGLPKAEAISNIVSSYPILTDYDLKTITGDGLKYISSQYKRNTSYCKVFFASPGTGFSALSLRLDKQEQ